MLLLRFVQRVIEIGMIMDSSLKVIVFIIVYSRYWKSVNIKTITSPNEKSD